MASSSREDQVVQEFHRSRRMFAWIPSQNEVDPYPQGATLELAPPNIPLSHREWVDTLNLGLDGQKLIRGFYTGKEFDHYGIYLYGPEFEVPDPILLWLKDNFDIFLSVLGIPALDTPVYLGMDVSCVGKPWSPKVSRGTLRDFFCSLVTE